MVLSMDLVAWVLSMDLVAWAILLSFLLASLFFSLNLPLLSPFLFPFNIQWSSTPDSETHGEKGYMQINELLYGIVNIMMKRGAM